MDMTGEQRIPASRDVVWKALNDPAVLQACIPGCQQLIMESETQMTAIAVVKVGPISAKFQGAVTLSDIDPPNSYRISGEGQGGVAGHAKGGAVVRLTEDGADTVLSYEVSVQIGGKLAQLGGRMIDATAKTLSAAFFRKFAEEIEQRYGASAALQATAGDGPQQGKTEQPIKGSASQPYAGQPHRAGHWPQPVHASAPLWSSLLAPVLLAAILCAALWLWPPHAAIEASSSGLGGTIQLVIVAAIGFLFGRQRAQPSTDRELLLALLSTRRD